MILAAVETTMMMMMLIVAEAHPHSNTRVEAVVSHNRWVAEVVVVVVDTMKDTQMVAIDAER